MENPRGNNSSCGQLFRHIKIAADPTDSTFPPGMYTSLLKDWVCKLVRSSRTESENPGMAAKPSSAHHRSVKHSAVYGFISERNPAMAPS